MTVAVFSDIHSNYHAFKACYEDALRCKAEYFIFLGDYISDLAEPEKTLDLLYEIHKQYPTVCLRGNREGYMLACEEGAASFSRGSQTGSLLFTYEHLRKRDITFFRSLKIWDIIELGGVRLEIAHAAPDNDRRYFDHTDGTIDTIASQMECQYLITGHSHKQYIHRALGKTIINPGSVGIPQDGTRWPKYAILSIENGEITCTFRQVRYDLADVIHSQFHRGLVDYAKYWAIGILYDVITGEEWVMKLLRSAQASGAVCEEAVWHRTAMELGMKCTEREIQERILCV